MQQDMHRAGIAKLLFAAALLIGSSLVASARAQTLHLVTAAATQDLTIGNGVQFNRTAMLSTMSAIANILHLRLNASDRALNIVDQDFHCAGIRQALNALAPGPDDIVVFYYSGHGGRAASDPSPLPTLACDDPSDPAAATARPLKLQDVAHDLSLKHARLTLVIADACNYALPPAPEALSVAALQAIDVAAYNRLFLHTSGVIVLDSSSPGEFSWYAADGGRFTNQFIATLKSPPESPSGATWDMFIAKVTEPIVIPIQVALVENGATLLKPGQTVLESPQALVRITGVSQ